MYLNRYIFVLFAKKTVPWESCISWIDCKKIEFTRVIAFEGRSLSGPLRVIFLDLLRSFGGVGPGIE